MEQQEIKKLQRVITGLMVAKDKISLWDNPGLATAMAHIENSIELVQSIVPDSKRLPVTGAIVWYRYHNEKWRLGTAQPYGIIPSTDPNETYNWYESNLQWQLAYVVPPKEGENKDE